MTDPVIESTHSGVRAKQLVVVVGSGFSSALTNGENAILGNQPLPTLAGLGGSLLSHMQQLERNGSRMPFRRDALQNSISALRRNATRPDSERYNFEEFVSLLSIGSTLARTSASSPLSSLPGANPETLRCILYCLSDFLASRLSYNGTTKANRNFFYRVNYAERAAAMKE